VLKVCYMFASSCKHPIIRSWHKPTDERRIIDERLTGVVRPPMQMLTPSATCKLPGYHTAAPSVYRNR